MINIEGLDDQVIGEGTKSYKLLFVSVVMTYWQLLAPFNNHKLDCVFIYYIILEYSTLKTCVESRLNSAGIYRFQLTLWPNNSAYTCKGKTMLMFLF
jgi:hypothetical protein